MEKLNITREEFRKVIEEVVLESGKEVGILNEIDKILPGILILNNKSIKIVAKYEDTNLVYKEFASIAYAAEHFYNDRTRRSPIKYALKKGLKFLDKYHLSYLK